MRNVWFLRDLNVLRYYSAIEMPILIELTVQYFIRPHWKTEIKSFIDYSIFILIKLQYS